jgi:hypothetical protein
VWHRRPRPRLCLFKGPNRLRETTPEDYESASTSEECPGIDFQSYRNCSIMIRL